MKNIIKFNKLRQAGQFKRESAFNSTMVCLLFIFLLLSMFLGVFAQAQDRCQIIGSPLGGYSFLKTDPKGGPDYLISYMNRDGSLNERYLTAMVKWIANQGGNTFCDFPFWIHTVEAYNILSPFEFLPNYKSKKLDDIVIISSDNPRLIHDDSIIIVDEKAFSWNYKYFSNQKRIVQICNQAGLVYKFYLFDQCGTRRIDNIRDFNPWRIYDNFFFGNDAREHRHEWIDKILETFKGHNVVYGICNEPRFEDNLSEFLSDTFVYLIKKGVPPENIEIGLDYKMKEFNSTYGATYRQFRNAVCWKLNNPMWATWLKSKCISPVHGASLKEVDKLFDPNQDGVIDTSSGGTRRILYSFDGLKNPRPNKETAFRIADYVLEVKSKAKNKSKVHFEVVLGKQVGDPLDSLSGISEAYKKHFGIWPSNYGRFPNVIFPPRTEPTPEELAELRLKLRQVSKKLYELQENIPLENWSELKEALRREYWKLRKTTKSIVW